MSRHILLLAVLAFIRADHWAPEPGFVSLFNGKDLTGWCVRAKTAKGDPQPGKITATFDGRTESEDGFCSVTDGVLAIAFPAEADGLTGQIYTQAEFPRDFILKLEFRASVNADSGIFIRKPQLQCRDYLVAGPYKKLKKYKPQDWNEVTVTVKDGVARCECNGEVLEDALAVPGTGPIGLEGDRGVVEYRRLQLKELP